MWREPKKQGAGVNPTARCWRTARSAAAHVARFAGVEHNAPSSDRNTASRPFTPPCPPCPPLSSKPFTPPWPAPPVRLQDARPAPSGPPVRRTMRREPAPPRPQQAMNRPWATAGALLLWGLACNTSLAQPSAERGLAVYEAHCSSCHSPDAHGDGPAHRGVVGRRAGALRDFDYSPALRNSRILWTRATLKAWLTNPEALIPARAWTTSWTMRVTARTWWPIWPRSNARGRWQVWQVWGVWGRSDGPITPSRAHCAAG